MKINNVTMTDIRVLSGIIQVNTIMSLLCAVHTTGGKVVLKRECPFMLSRIIVGTGKINPNKRADTCRDRLFHGVARNL